MAIERSNKILCVDDEPNVLHMFKRTLGRKYQILTTPSAEEALHLLHTHHDVAAIISDYSMPGLNGIQFLKRAREISSDSVQIVLTGNAELDVSIQAINETDVFRYLPKPCPAEVLYKAVQDALAQYYLLSEKRRIDQELEQKNRELATINAELNHQKYLLEHELELARTVYSNVVSSDQNTLDGLDYLVTPQNRAGGDFLLTHIGPDKQTFYLLMGDLTGHGLQSALAALLVAEVFEQQCKLEPDIAHLASRINDKMHHKLPTELFCAALLLKLDLVTQQLHLWLGSMPDIYLLNAQGQITDTLPSNNLPLGILADQDFSDSTYCRRVSDVDTLFCCSDGVSEQLDNARKQFGTDRLQKALTDTPSGIRRIDFVMSQLRHHQQQQTQTDDISLLELNLPRLSTALEHT